MAVSEFQRHQIIQWLEGAMGSEKAAIMMDLLPPVGWGDIATGADLDNVRMETRAEVRLDVGSAGSVVRDEELRMAAGELGHCGHADGQKKKNPRRLHRCRGGVGGRRSVRSWRGTATTTRPGSTGWRPRAPTSTARPPSCGPTTPPPCSTPAAAPAGSPSSWPGTASRWSAPTSTRRCSPRPAAGPAHHLGRGRPHRARPRPHLRRRRDGRQRPAVHAARHRGRPRRRRRPPRRAGRPARGRVQPRSRLRQRGVRRPRRRGRAHAGGAVRHVGPAALGRRRRLRRVGAPSRPGPTRERDVEPLRYTRRLEAASGIADSTSAVLRW